MLTKLMNPVATAMKGSLSVVATAATVALGLIGTGIVVLVVYTLITTH